MRGRSPKNFRGFPQGIHRRVFIGMVVQRDVIRDAQTLSNVLFRQANPCYAFVEVIIFGKVSEISSALDGVLDGEDRRTGIAKIGFNDPMPRLMQPFQRFVFAPVGNDRNRIGEMIISNGSLELLEAEFFIRARQFRLLVTAIADSVVQP
jgi:hypothetical protein